MKTSSEDPLVTIRVGTREFCTRRSTLEQYPDTVLYRWVCFETPSSNNNFWDRDEQAFSTILEFYRTGKLIPPSGMSMEKLNEELEFWGFVLEPLDRVPRSLVFPFLHYKGPTPNMKCPLGLSLRAMDKGCHAVLVCLAWSAMTRTKAIWESASVGRRDIVVYWKQTTFSGMCPALLRNHEGFLKDLARSEICDVSIGRPIAATDIARFCRQHDISTSGTLSYSCKGKTVHEWPLTVSGMRRESNMVVFSVDGTQRTRFEYRGFQISLAATGERLWWSIELVDQSKLQELSPWSLQDTAGFLLATVAVIDTTLVELFRFPTCGSRSEQLSGDAFLSSHYTVPTPHPPSWYHDDKRGKYVESVFLDFGLPGSDTPVDIVLLVEEKQDVVLSYNKAGDYRAERETDLYDPVSISW